ncbi:sensor histidine kinase [Paenochrobactrum pullorum]|uniref:sensor histidine kinase n=1 Tax=Paenochrobactrum pullorum TaxID=1324351 RepID=UPI0035BC3CC0
MFLVLSADIQQKIKKKWRVAAISISLALVLISATSTVYLTIGVTRQIDDIKHSYELSQQVDMLMRLAFNLEANRKGYLLTLEEPYLDSYQFSLRSLQETLDVIESIVVDDRDKTARVTDIKNLIGRVDQDVRYTIDMAKNKRLDEALDRVRQDEAAIFLAQLDKVVSLFLSDESVQLAERNKQIDRTRNMLTATSMLALLSAVVLVVLLFSRLQRSVRRLNEGHMVLRSENEELEQKVQQRTAELLQEREVAERERSRVEVLLQDSNHRIGNSLAQVSSLLSLQMRQIDNDDARKALDSARARIHTISIAHRRLRLGKDLETARVDEFLHAVVQDIIQQSNNFGDKIKFKTDFSSQSFHARDVTTIGIILGELVTNSLKHAFHNRSAGEVYIRFQPAEDGKFCLVVKDDGNGWNGEKKCAGLGAIVVEQLSQQYGGKPHYSEKHENGTAVTIKFTSLKPAE